MNVETQSADTTPAEETTTPTESALEKELATETSSTPPSDTTDDTVEAAEEEVTEEESEVEEGEGEEEGEYEPVTADDILENAVLPEGYEFLKDDPLMQEFVSLLNDEEGTVADLGGKLAGLYAKAMEANQQTWLDTQAEWVDELRNDPNIGGDKLDPALGKIDVLIRDYASSLGEKAATADESLRAQLSLTGAGNNPEIIRFLHWISLQHGEGAPLGGGSVGGERSRADILFG